jgi:hypothetical protein
MNRRSVGKQPQKNKVPQKGKEEKKKQRRVAEGG